MWPVYSSLREVTYARDSIFTSSSDMTANHQTFVWEFWMFLFIRMALCNLYIFYILLCKILSRNLHANKEVLVQRITEAVSLICWKSQDLTSQRDTKVRPKMGRQFFANVLLCREGHAHIFGRLILSHY